MNKCTMIIIIKINNIVYIIFLRPIHLNISVMANHWVPSTATTYAPSNRTKYLQDLQLKKKTTEINNQYNYDK